MYERIFKLIDNEDKRNPLTDEKIAELIGIKREDVTHIRLEKGIEDSRERRRAVLRIDAKNILESEGDLSDRKFTLKLNEMGYQISRHIAKSLKEELEGCIRFKEVKSSAKSFPKSFENVIGSEGSVKLQISQAKAAILYPPNGLHTLINGESGVGKSQLAEEMYQFAIESDMLQKESPFVVFNCADYADNPQLLIAQLFGYKKGAFTGAESNHDGIVEKANGGILFLDEVHRLPSEGQEMLFYLLDKGKYRRLGETDTTREATIMIIAATTENIESVLLATFRRRIPMVINIPCLSQRPISERLQIIKRFLRNETKRVDKNLTVKKEAIKALLIYPCYGNIGQLSSDIQVSCANGFLKYISNQRSEFAIGVEDLPIHVSSALNKIEIENLELLNYVGNDLFISNKGNDNSEFGVNVSEFSIYQVIEQQYKILNEKGYGEQEIYEKIGKKLDTEFAKLLTNVKINEPENNRIEEIVGPEIINAAKSAIEIAKNKIPNLNENILYPISLHIKATYERIRNGKPVVNPQKNDIKKQYPSEFLTAKYMALKIGAVLDIDLPEDEIGFITMYIKTFSNKNESEKGRIGVIVLSHGEVGSAMAAVANSLLNVNLAVGINIDLNESPQEAFIKTLDMVKKIDEGRGCIILSDMGSLLTFSEGIYKNTGIDTRTVSRVDTVMVVDAVRRVIIPETTLDELEKAINDEKAISFHNYAGNQSTELSNVIVTTCITGEGSAILMKEHINQSMSEGLIGIEVICIGISSGKSLENEISNIKAANKNIIAFAGNINPHDGDIPFISSQEILNGKGIAELTKIISKYNTKKSSLAGLINKDIILCDFESNYKNHILDTMVSMMEKNNNVTSEYILSVYKRETMGATILGKAAIPHGYPEYVTKPAIGIIKLKTPIVWENKFETRIILMPAFQEEASKYLKDLYYICSNENLINKILNATNAEEIEYILSENTKPAK